MAWNPQQYLKFSGHRLRPALDLLMRIPDFEVRSVADLGAGAGNVTKLIKERWPDAVVVGVEGSLEMVAAGKKAAPEVEWLHQDLGSWRPAHKYDLIYSNAALHWLPDHARLFPSLMEKIEPGGILAVQMPRNFGAPSHLLIAETALNGPWRAKLEHLVTAAPVQEPAFYHNLLARQSEELDIWETEYLQVLEGENPVKEWTKGTWLMRYLDALQGDEKAAFEAAYVNALRKPTRRIQRARHFSHSGDCSWWLSAKPDAVGHQKGRDVYGKRARRARSKIRPSDRRLA